jgi:hypothetical protein
MGRQKQQLPPPDVAVGYDVVSFLNEERDSTASAKVRRFFDLCCKLDSLRETRGAARAGAVKNLNAALRDFRFAPCLIDGGQSYRVLWGPAPAPAAIVGQILRMTEAGTIDRVRQCVCGRWFLAESNKKRVCSDACRFQKFMLHNQDTLKVVKAKKRRINGKTKAR